MEFKHGKHVDFSARHLAPLFSIPASDGALTRAAPQSAERLAKAAAHKRNVELHKPNLSLRVIITFPSP